MKQDNLLLKGLKVLEVLRQEQDTLGFGGIQRKLALPRTTLYRILKTLRENNFISYLAEERKYKLGTAILVLANRVLSGISLRETAGPCLKRLCEETKETAELVVPDGKAILYIDRSESPESIRLVAQIGSRYETLHASASGKIALAFARDVCEDFFREGKFEKVTAKTITDKDTLKKEIEKIRKDGWAYDDGEARIDVRRIAAPILDYSGALAGIIGIAGPAFRIRREKLKRFALLVKKQAEEVSRKLGYRREKQ